LSFIYTPILAFSWLSVREREIVKNRRTSEPPHSPQSHALVIVLLLPELFEFHLVVGIGPFICLKPAGPNALDHPAP